MYGIYSYIYHTYQLNIGQYTIHRSYGYYGYMNVHGLFGYTNHLINPFCHFASSSGAILQQSALTISQCVCVVLCFWLGFV